jgi:putative PIN family toxin of toxin-antitoxin system
MIRAILDTNVLVSAILVPAGISARILLVAYAQLFQCFASEAIVAEVMRALLRDRVQRKYRIDQGHISRLQDFLESDAVRVSITVNMRGVASHPEDDLILATAVSSQADYLVTGDRQVLALGTFQGVQIVTPGEFATILGLTVTSISVPPEPSA